MPTVPISRTRPNWSARTARAARSAQRSVAAARRELKDAGLHAMADGLLEATEEILAANRDDVERARAEGMTEGLIDRLSLTPDRIAAIAVSLREIAGLPDPIGEVVDWSDPSQRSSGAPCARSHGRGRHDLRGPSQCHCRCCRPDA